jgi:uncharacterized membrane protein YqhA
MGWLERTIEHILWSSRLAAVVGVVASIVVAVGLFFATTVDAVVMIGLFLAHGNPGLSDQAREVLRAEAITGVVKIVDGYLLAAIMLIFGLGLYELFVNRIDVAREDEAGPRLLRTRSLDELKERLAKVILLVLIVEFFQYALRLPYTTSLDLVYLAVGLLCVGAAIFLTREKANAGKAGADEPSARGARHD